MDRPNGLKDTSFVDLAKEGTMEFGNLFKEDSRVTIDAIKMWLLIYPTLLTRMEIIN